VHVLIEKREFDSETGEKLSTPQRYITNVGAFRNFLKYKNGFSINEILHRPAEMEEFEADPWKRK